MKNITNIIRAYTIGEATLEDTNVALKEAGASVYLDPDKNVITDEERAATVIGNTPAEVNGWGLLDSGTSSYDKVRVENGRLMNCDMGESFAMVFIGGKTYEVKGTVLI